MDQRIIKTKKALCNALGRLLQEKEFNRISVSDIVREAGITRKTFYNHYQDKIEMVQDYQMKLSEKIQEHIRCHEKIDREFFVDLFLLLGQQDALLTGLFSIHGSPSDARDYKRHNELVLCSISLPQEKRVLRKRLQISS